MPMIRPYSRISIVPYYISSSLISNNSKFMGQCNNIVSNVVGEMSEAYRGVLNIRPYLIIRK